MSDIAMLTTASEIWEFLRVQGGTDLVRYDTELEDELRRRLHLPDGKLDDLLARHPVTVEAFVHAFFRCAQPFVNMMSDLLAMFERANATEGSHNLNVEFDFGEGHAGLKFDLEHFRRWIEIWRQVLRLTETELWDYRSLWGLNDVMRARFDTLGGFRETVVGTAVSSWMAAYMDGIWPLPLPEPPQTGFADLDPLLARAWNVWTDVFEATSGLAPDRRALRESRFDEDRAGDERPRAIGELSPRFLRGVDSDHWAGSFAVGAYAHAEHIRSLNATGAAAYAADLASDLQNAFDRVPTVQAQVHTLVRALQDFLRLPLWERRYELYSAWVSTQIVAALKEYGVRIHQDNGVLTFAFSGTHLATCDSLIPHLHIWAEMRSPLENPKGEGRKNAIQPDYTLLVDPLTARGSAVLVVECKQYLQASAEKFAAALDDYARGRPTAKIVLVNYGPARAEIADRVEDPELRTRVHVIGGLRPGNTTALKAFYELVRQAVARYPFAVRQQTSRAIRTVRTPFTVTLTWDAEPADLDLRLEIGGDSSARPVTYSDRGSEENFPWATYADDVRGGYGPEQIVVHRLADRPYRVSVHKFSSDHAPLAGCGARVTVTTEEGVLELTCPRDGEGSWWALFTVDGGTGGITEVNQLMTELPPL